MKKLILFMLIAVMAFSFCACNGNKVATEGEVVNSDYKSAIEQCYNAMAKGDAEAWYAVIADPQNVSRTMADMEFSSEDELKGYLAENAKGKKTSFVNKFGENYTIEFNYTNVVEYTAEDVQKVSAYLESKEGYPANYISGLVYAEFDLIVKGDKAEETTKEKTLATNVNGKWYVGNIPLSGKFIDDILSK